MQQPSCFQFQQEPERLDIPITSGAEDLCFDQLALDADQLGDRDHVLEQLGVLMNNCIACHAQYRLEAVATAGNSTTR